MCVWWSTWIYLSSIWKVHSKDMQRPSPNFWVSSCLIYIILYSFILSSSENVFLLQKPFLFRPRVFCVFKDFQALPLYLVQVAMSPSWTTRSRRCKTSMLGFWGSNRWCHAPFVGTKDRNIMKHIETKLFWAQVTEDWDWKSLESGSFFLFFSIWHRTVEVGTLEERLDTCRYRSKLWPTPMCATLSKLDVCLNRRGIIGKIFPNYVAKKGSCYPENPLYRWKP